MHRKQLITLKRIENSLQRVNNDWPANEGASLQLVDCVIITKSYWNDNYSYIIKITSWLRESKQYEHQKSLRVNMCKQASIAIEKQRLQFHFSLENWDHLWNQKKGEEMGQHRNKDGSCFQKQTHYHVVSRGEKQGVLAGRLFLGVVTRKNA